ncbi:MAG: NAD(P)-dependent oxidoreductase [Oscillospiraceae bacterium]|nr:NAD(P)-dependent oxidoreductase [Oscillospiraceae bacterium]
MKTLVTGSTGHFGPGLVRELINRGHEVVLMGTGEPLPEFSALQWVSGNINSAEDCMRAMKGMGFDAVHNAAAMPDPTDIPPFKGHDDPAVFPIGMQTNIIGLYNMLEAARRCGVEIFVNTGSNCALGHGYRITDRPFELKYLPIDEDHPSDAEDSYSLSKLLGESLLEKYSRVYGMRCYSLRPAVILNAECRKRWKAETAPTAEWDEWLMAWTSGEDLASAHCMLMEQARSIVPFGCYYCINDDTVKTEPTMDIIKTYRPDLIPLIREPLPGHTSLFSSKRLKAAIGWEPIKSWRG